MPAISTIFQAMQASKDITYMLLHNLNTCTCISTDPLPYTMKLLLGMWQFLFNIITVPLFYSYIPSIINNKSHAQRRGFSTNGVHYLLSFVSVFLLHMQVSGDIQTPEMAVTDSIIKVQVLKSGFHFIGGG